MSEENKNPKVFLSYCWTSKEYKQRVIDLSISLVHNGVALIFDEWDLKEGQDSYKFMEKMVNDKEIKKVIILCNKQYCKKANDRTGGVGTETQIISNEVYQNSDQTKFVVVVVERNEKDEPYLPAYYTNRIYIDLSQNSKYGDEFEKLLRWIYDKPLNKKPELGKMPAFLNSENPKSLKTSIIYSSLGNIKHLGEMFNITQNCKDFPSCMASYKSTWKLYFFKKRGSQFGQNYETYFEDVYQRVLD